VSSEHSCLLFSPSSFRLMSSILILDYIPPPLGAFGVGCFWFWGFGEEGWWFGEAGLGFCGVLWCGGGGWGFFVVSSSHLHVLFPFSFGSCDFESRVLVLICLPRAIVFPATFFPFVRI